VNGLQSCLYVGEVVHKRLKPVQHELRYRVYNLFVDVDELPLLSRRLGIFSYNRFNLLGLADRDHGDGDGSPIGQHLRKLARTVPEGANVSRFFMFCYPKVLGYVFNPLTVYYGYDAEGGLRLMIYEVNNTFGGRKTYVLPARQDLPQRTRKAFYVSPFNKVEGEYGFHVSAPADRLAIGITLTTPQGPTLKAYFSGHRRPLTQANLWKCFLGVPLQGFKVMAAIHWEALKLLLKGLRIQPRAVDNDAVMRHQPQDLK
jgi:DUF1365 family protein